MEKKKREMGRYFTVGNPFQTRAFRDWARALEIANGRIYRRRISWRQAEDIIGEVLAAG